jgi:two-component system sensor histidine kinase BaeS
VKGDAEKLWRAVANLGENAARHASSTVRFTLETKDGEVRLCVEDDGAGIPPDSREFVFQRFARLDGARDREHGGAGLGLAIVAAVAEAHGGKAFVAEGSLPGASFNLVLPSEA